MCTSSTLTFKVCTVNISFTVTQHMRSQKQFHHGDLRNALLAASRKLVAQAGPESFSLREASRAAGVSPNAAYRHFADKNALLAELSKCAFADMAVMMEQAMNSAGGDAMARLKATGIGYASYACEEPCLFNLMFGPFGAGSSYDVNGVGPSGLTPYQLLLESLDCLVREKRMSSAKRKNAETFLWSALHGLAVLVSTSAIDGPILKRFDELFRFVTSALEIKPLAKRR
jgi:AcrR family transcriptional regulator